MTSKRMFYLLNIVLFALSAAGIGAAVLGNGMLEKSATRLNELKLETNVIDEQQNSLLQALRDIEKYSELEQIAKSVVPQEKDQARTVREIVKFAAETGVPIKSITFPSSELGSSTLITQTPSTSTETDSATPAKPAPPPFTQVKPVEGIKGLYQMEVSIQNDKDSQVRYQSLINFLKKLEQNRRTSQVTNVVISPDPKNRSLLTYSMTINVYIKP